MDYKLVLVEHIHEWEEKGWELVSQKVHLSIGGWASAWMKRRPYGEKRRRKEQT